MKIKSVLSLTVASILALAGCTSTPEKVSSGPVKAQTFNFFTRVPQLDRFPSDSREAVHEKFQQAITSNLAARGIKKVAHGGDLGVGYMVFVGDNVSTTIYKEYYGYGPDASALHDKVHEAYTENKNPNYFKAGTLVIDIFDTKTHKLLKRSHATRPVLRDPATQSARIQEVVDEVLRDLQIAN